jgi:hypothetical protein
VEIKYRMCYRAGVVECEKMVKRKEEEKGNEEYQNRK